MFLADYISEDNIYRVCYDSVSKMLKDINMNYTLHFLFYIH